MKNDFKTLLISTCIDYALNMLSGNNKMFEDNNSIIIRNYQDEISNIFEGFDKKDVVEIMKEKTDDERIKKILDFAMTTNDCRCHTYLSLLTILYSEFSAIADFLSNDEYLTEQNIFMLYSSVRGFRNLEQFINQFEGDY